MLSSKSRLGYRLGCILIACWISVSNKHILADTWCWPGAGHCWPISGPTGVLYGRMTYMSQLTTTALINVSDLSIWVGRNYEFLNCSLILCNFSLFTLRKPRSFSIECEIFLEWTDYTSMLTLVPDFAQNCEITNFYIVLVCNYSLFALRKFRSRFS